MRPPLFKRWAPIPVTHEPSPSATSESVATPSRPTPDPIVPEASHAPESQRPAKKPKKRKREAEIVEEESPKKHRTILSKFEKVSRAAEATRGLHEPASQAKEQDEEEEEELHDLQPMPQPAPVPEPAFESFSTLPAWLAQPYIVDASKTLPFDELGVDPVFVETLKTRGLTDALAVQTALIPMLHSGFEQHLGDICVSAKTGSGKTLAYLLPIVEALKHRVVPVLSAIIIVPSRQLVNQALAVAEELCVGTKIRVGTALGNVAFATEQQKLVKMRALYDPKGAEELQKRASERFRTGSFDNEGIFDDLRKVPPDHVPVYDSGVDVLICTPGRLVEHIENTTGFQLNNLRWLVIDEADQLLSQNFQGWANVLMEALHGETPVDFMNPSEFFRKRERDANSIWSLALPARHKAAKIVLSATMEKDLTKLGTLKLTRPKLVVIQDDTMAQHQSLEHEENHYELPSTLDEFAVHVGDGSNKPLHLLHVLLNYIFPDTRASKDEDMDLSPLHESDSDGEEASIAKSTNRVLIFTKSTESASRLSHLLVILRPAFRTYLQKRTRDLTAEASRKLVKSFSTGTTRILIATDGLSRGVDIPSITHVINYDVPRDAEGYVHRVGRTARAGKAGQAWTLFTKTEAAWFLKEVTKGDAIKRPHKVKRLEWKESAVTADGRKQAYRAALEQLESDVAGA